ncbi:hypothetical protein [Niveispirillum lacus]|uniref:hypothetical protein n=1 Tax=Niveispirillum lacus TaxID=1981099 RepID=UPI00105623F9|nr:hypothetical protein [Niveispirillum lacus]
MSKIITLVGILAIVWFAFRLLGKVQRQRAESLRRHGGVKANPKGGPRAREKTDAADTQEMAKCSVCGVYVAAGSGRCGTPGCPR